MVPLDWQQKTRLIFGENSVVQVGEVAREFGGRVLLVTDAGIVRAGHAARVTKLLEAAGLVVGVYDDVRENPTTRDVDECVAAARDVRADVLVAVGGGSSIDTVKGANFLLTNGGVMRDYVGHGKATKPMLPLVAVPTTAGTGSEVQSFAIIADDETHAKMPIGDPKAAPKVAILDPILTLSLPPRVTAHTGMDAISHAVESLVANNANPISQMFSREAFCLLPTAFIDVCRESDNLDARGRMLLGSAFAGLAIENSMLGAAHSAANPLTARHTNITHGQAVGVMLPHIVRFNGEIDDTRNRYESLLRAAGWTIHRKRGGAETLAEMLESLLLTSAGMATTLAELNVSRDAIPEMAREAAMQRTAQFNPRPVGVEDFERLYELAVNGS